MIEVEKDLGKEIDVIVSVAELLQITSSKITEQIRKNRSARYHLEKVRSNTNQIFSFLGIHFPL